MRFALLRGQTIEIEEDDFNVEDHERFIKEMLLLKTNYTVSKDHVEHNVILNIANCNGVTYWSSYPLEKCRTQHRLVSNAKIPPKLIHKNAGTYQLSKEKVKHLIEYF